MKRFSLYSLIITLFLSHAATAQYYYNDILSNQKSNAEYQALKNSGINDIALESFEDDDSPSEGFFCEKKFNNDFSTSRMISRSYITGESELQTFYKDGRVVKTITTTPHAKSTLIYSYTSGRLDTVSIETFGDADSVSFREMRIFSYDDGGTLRALRRIRNGKQISTIGFVSDANGKIVEENPSAGSSDRQYYYYYNDKNELTDVVHYNEVAKKLLPDYMFLYNGQGQVTQMISVDESARNYFIWRYSYTAQGLPEIQKCYSREKRLLGTIQFEYRKN